MPELVDFKAQIARDQYLLLAQVEEIFGVVSLLTELRAIHIYVHMRLSKIELLFIDSLITLDIFEQNLEFESCWRHNRLESNGRAVEYHELFVKAIDDRNLG